MATQAFVDEMGIDNLGFLIENLGKDSGELQFLRELTQNAIEAIQRAGRDGCIEIDWEQIDGVNKLRITDNGIGMTAEEVRDNINRLSSSGSQQAFNRNFGIGAKITAAVKNPDGVLYRAWKDGVGSLTLLGKVNDRYGRIGWPSHDGARVDYWLPIPASTKPAIVNYSGVSVVLLGKSQDDDTTTAPPGVDVPSQWIATYLERRYFELPNRIQVRVKRPVLTSDTNKDAIYDTIHGQRHYLDKHSSARGVVSLPEVRARAWWWLLTSEIQKGGKTWDNYGHVATLYQNELYDPRRATARFSALKDFGVYAGHSRIVIYVEPEEVLGANASRSSVILPGGNGLDHPAIGAAFAGKMPDELAIFMAGQVTAEQSDHRKAILKNLKEVDRALAMSRLCRSSPGRDMPVEADAGGRTATGDGVRGANRSTRTEQSAGGRLGGDYFRRAREEADLLRVREVEDDPLPKIVWDPTGEAVPEGRAATYTPARHVVTVNERFWFYEDLKACCIRESATRRAVGVGEAVIAALAEAIVKRWFEEALMQTVVSLRGLATHPAWGPKVFNTALSDEGLTAAVLSHRWLLLSQVRRELGVRLGRMKDHAA